MNLLLLLPLAIPFGCLALLSLLAFQFPEFGNVFFFWVNGMQNAFK